MHQQQQNPRSLLERMGLRHPVAPNMAPQEAKPATARVSGASRTGKHVGAKLGSGSAHASVSSTTVTPPTAPAKPDAAAKPEPIGALSRKLERRFLHRTPQSTDAASWSSSTMAALESACTSATTETGATASGVPRGGTVPCSRTPTSSCSSVVQTKDSKKSAANASTSEVDIPSSNTSVQKPNTPESGDTKQRPIFIFSPRPEAKKAVASSGGQTKKAIVRSPTTSSTTIPEKLAPASSVTEGRLTAKTTSIVSTAEADKPRLNASTNAKKPQTPESGQTNPRPLFNFRPEAKKAIVRAPTSLSAPDTNGAQNESVPKPSAPSTGGKQVGGSIKARVKHEKEESSLIAAKIAIPQASSMTPTVANGDSDIDAKIHIVPFMISDSTELSAFSFLLNRPCRSAFATATTGSQAPTSGTAGTDEKPQVSDSAASSAFSLPLAKPPSTLRYFVPSGVSSASVKALSAPSRVNLKRKRSASEADDDAREAHIAKRQKIEHDEPAASSLLTSIPACDNDASDAQITKKPEIEDDESVASKLVASTCDNNVSDAHIAKKSKIEDDESAALDLVAARPVASFAPTLKRCVREGDCDGYKNSHVSKKAKLEDDDISAPLSSVTAPLLQKILQDAPPAPGSLEEYQSATSVATVLQVPPSAIPSTFLTNTTNYTPGSIRGVDTGVQAPAPAPVPSMETSASVLVSGANSVMVGKLRAWGARQADDASHPGVQPTSTSFIPWTSAQPSASQAAHSPVAMAVDSVPVGPFAAQVPLQLSNGGVFAQLTAAASTSMSSAFTTSAPSSAMDVDTFSFIPQTSQGSVFGSFVKSSHISAFASQSGYASVLSAIPSAPLNTWSSFGPSSSSANQSSASAFGWMLSAAQSVVDPNEDVDMAEGDYDSEGNAWMRDENGRIL